jgi:Arc-like DNA binding dprotein
MKSAKPKAMDKKAIPVLVRMPPALLRKLEAVAKTENRSRNREACLRLANSFKKPRGEGKP